MMVSYDDETTDKQITTRRVKVFRQAFAWIVTAVCCRCTKSWVILDRVDFFL